MISCQGKQRIRDWLPYNGPGGDGERATNIDNGTRTEAGYVRTPVRHRSRLRLKSG